jgi:hypothetical protein
MQKVHLNYASLSTYLSGFMLLVVPDVQCIALVVHIWAPRFTKIVKQFLMPHTLLNDCSSCSFHKVTLSCDRSHVWTTNADI